MFCSISTLTNYSYPERVCGWKSSLLLFLDPWGTWESTQTELNIELQ